MFRVITLHAAVARCAHCRMANNVLKIFVIKPRAWYIIATAPTPQVITGQAFHSASNACSTWVNIVQTLIMCCGFVRRFQPIFFQQYAICFVRLCLDRVFPPPAFKIEVGVWYLRFSLFSPSIPNFVHRFSLFHIYTKTNRWYRGCCCYMKSRFHSPFMFRLIPDEFPFYPDM